MSKHQGKLFQVQRKDYGESYTVHARARRDDPATSHEAAAAVESTGLADTQRDDILAIVRAEPGLTADEVAERYGTERCIASRRLPELREDLLIHNGPVRHSTINGRRCLTWWPTGKDTTDERCNDEARR